MDVSVFDDPLKEIQEDIAVDIKQSKKSTTGKEQIYPELVLAMMLRFLTGDSKRTLSNLFGMPKSSAKG
eukprot:480011-Ditylum_brightwellii.AAC.1